MDRSANVLQRLKGPVVPINLCFNENGSVNFEAVRKYVDWLCVEKVPILMLTYGSSEFASLTDDDIWRLTADVADSSRGRSLVIASTGWWPPTKCRDFLIHADKVGADAVKVQIHPWIPKERAAIVRFLDLIQDAAGIPLILWGHTPPPFPVDVAAELALRPGIVGIKNDGDAFYDLYDLCRATEGRDFVVISGGQMRNFVFGHQIGASAYLCTIAPFLPALALQFYDLLVAHRYEEAWQFVFRYEDQWLKTACRLDWGPSIKSALNLYGLYPNNIWLPPTASHTPEQREEIRLCLEQVFGRIEEVQL